MRSNYKHDLSKKAGKWVPFQMPKRRNNVTEEVPIEKGGKIRELV